MERSNIWNRSSLTILFTFCLSIFLQIRTGAVTASTTQPGLEFIPHPSKENSRSTLIWYNTTNFETHAAMLDEFFKPYRDNKTHDNIYICDYGHPPPKGKFCNVNLENFGPCAPENSISNYYKQSPCVFLKLNNIPPGWIPQFYNDSSKLPKFMPSHLKDYISNVESVSPNRLDTVWVTCEGENAADIEFIGPLVYYPITGFPGYYFSMESSVKHLSPLIAIHFKRPQVGVVIFVECKLWASNIVQDRGKLLGVTQFQLLLD